MVDFNSLSNIYQQLTYVFTNIQLIIAVLGIIGNVFVFAVFSRPSMSKYSYSFYSRIMAISDICILIQCIKNWASYSLDANLDTVLPFLCSLGQYLTFFFGALSVFILTLITADRMIAIVYSNRFAFLKKRWFQWIMVLIGVVLMTMENILFAIKSEIVVNLGTNSSTKVCSVESNIREIQSLIIVSYFACFNILINNALNAKMICFIASSRRRVAANLGHQHSASSSYRDRKFAVTSIGLNLTCMVLKLPFTLITLITIPLVIDFDELVAIKTIIITIAVLDNGFSFVINLFVNSFFYDEFLMMIRVKKQHLPAN